MLEQQKQMVDATSLEGLDSIFVEKKLKGGTSGQDEQEQKRKEKHKEKNRNKSEFDDKEPQKQKHKEKNKEKEKKAKHKDKQKDKSESKSDLERDPRGENLRKNKETGNDADLQNGPELRQDSNDRKKVASFDPKTAGEEAAAWIEKIITGPNRKLERGRKNQDAFNRSAVKPKKYALPQPGEQGTSETRESSLSARISKSLDAARQTVARPIDNFFYFENQYKDHIRSLQDALQVLHARLLGLEHKLSVREDELDERRNIIAAHEEEILDRERVIAESQQLISGQKQLIVEHEGIIAEQERSIAVQQDVIAKYESLMLEHEQTIAAREEMIALQQQLLADRENQRERLLCEHEQLIAVHEERAQQFAERELELIERERKAEEKICLLEAKVAALESTLASNKSLRQRIADLEFELAYYKRSWWKKLLGIT